MVTNLVASGTLNTTIVEPRDVYREAAMGGAFAVIVFHNHPSGDPAPSPDDVGLTQRLKAAGVSPKQVQVVWLKQAIARPAAGFPAETKRLQELLSKIVNILSTSSIQNLQRLRFSVPKFKRSYFPRLSQVIISKLSSSEELYIIMSLNLS